MRTRSHIHQAQTFGDRAADAVVSGMGSWMFIIIQTIIVALWITCNLLAFVFHWDPYPFILLNLVFSTQAAYASPLILMSQNRQSAKDRARDDHEAAEVDMLFTINGQQLQILEQQQTILQRLDAQQESIHALESAGDPGSAPSLDRVHDPLPPSEPQRLAAETQNSTPGSANPSL